MGELPCKSVTYLLHHKYLMHYVWGSTMWDLILHPIYNYAYPSHSGRTPYKVIFRHFFTDVSIYFIYNALAGCVYQGFPYLDGWVNGWVTI